MRYSYYSGIFELLVDERHDFLLSFHINIGSGFIKDYHSVFTKNGSTNANQLLLTDWEVAATLRDK